MKPLIPLVLVLAIVVLIACGDEDLEFGEPSDNTATPTTTGTTSPDSTATPEPTNTTGPLATNTPGL